MAIYHLHAQIIGRTAGRSVCAAAAYRSASKIYDRTTGEVFDFTKKSKAMTSGMLSPENAPEWTTDREELWNKVEEKENRKNSQFAREIDAAIPYELLLHNVMREIHDKTIAEKFIAGCIDMKSSEAAAFAGKSLIEEFCRENFVSRGLVCDYAIHKPDKQGNQKNIHAHIMITTRTVNEQGWGEKDRGTNDRKFLQKVRESWQNICNERLKAIGSEERIDCRTLEEQEVEKIPQQHQGVMASAMERKGKRVERTREQSKEEYERKKAKKYAKMPEVKVSEEEITAALRSDKEASAIEQRLELLNVPPKDWEAREAEFRKYEERQKEEAFAMAVEEAMTEIGEIYRKEKESSEAMIEQLERNKPELIEKKLFRAYVDSAGRKHNKYEEYAAAQQAYIDEWEKRCERQKEERRRLDREGLEYEIAKEIRMPIQLKIFAESNKKRSPVLYQRLVSAGKLLLETLERFEPYRRLRKAMNAVTEAKREQRRLALEAEQRRIEEERERKYQETLERIRIDGSLLERIEQTPGMCLEAVRQNGYNLKYVKEQTDEVCLAAVMRKGDALKHVKNKTPDICVKAVRQNKEALYCLFPKETQYIENSVEKLEDNVKMLINEQRFKAREAVRILHAAMAEQEQKMVAPFFEKRLKVERLTSIDKLLEKWEGTEQTSVKRTQKPRDYGGLGR